MFQQKREPHHYEAHRQRVDSARPIVDTKPPQTYMHLHLNMKKLQIEEARLAEIERDNRKLLQRMSEIMRTRGAVDNRNDYQARSLNLNVRRHERLHVTRENSRIHSKILSSKPDYDHKRWASEWETNRKRIENKSAFGRERTETSLAKESQERQAVHSRAVKNEDRDSTMSKRTTSKQDDSVVV